MFSDRSYSSPETLTSFIKDKEILAAVSEQLNIPVDIIKNAPIKAEPKTKRYVITGTAFELFISFRLYREFPEKCLNKIDFNVFENCAEMNAVWLDAWTDAKKEIQKYIINKHNADDKFFKALIVAANLMNMHRSGALPLDINKAGPDEIQDLKNLMEIIPWERFEPKKYAAISPSFNCKDTNVCAADGDLIIDGTLIDIKTIQKNTNNRMIWCQLAGYYQLFKNRGLKNFSKAQAKKIDIHSLGVYFSRHGELQILKDDSFFKFPKEDRNLSSIFLN